MSIQRVLYFFQHWYKFLKMYVIYTCSARSVTSYYESEKDTPVDYIMPMMTQPYDFKKYK